MPCKKNSPGKPCCNSVCFACGSNSLRLTGFTITNSPTYVPETNASCASCWGGTFLAFSPEVDADNMVGDAPINSGNNFDCTDPSQLWPNTGLGVFPNLCYTCEPTGNTATKCSRFFAWDLGCCTDTETYNYTDTSTLPFTTRSWSASFIERTRVELCLTLEKVTVSGVTYNRISPVVRLIWMVQRTGQAPGSLAGNFSGNAGYFTCPYPDLTEECSTHTTDVTEFVYVREYMPTAAINVTDCYSICDSTIDLALQNSYGRVRVCDESDNTINYGNAAFSEVGQFFTVTDNSIGSNEPMRYEPCKYSSISIQFSGCTPPEAPPP